MRYLIFVTLILMLALSASALTLSYEKSITTQNAPYPLAVNSSGGLFYATFDAGNSKVYYIADPINDPNTVVTISSSAFTDFPTGRGLQGVAVDSSGNLYACGDKGSGVPAAFKKFNPPSFTEDSTFAPDMTGVRILGCANFESGDRKYIATNTFNSIRFYDAIDGSYDGAHYTDNLPSYQRDIAINTNNWDIFTSRNGANTVGSVCLFTGGSPNNLNGYSRVTTTFITNTERSSTYGTAAHGIGFYAPDNLLFVGNKGTENPTDNVGQLDIYQITGTGSGASATLITSITGLESGTQLGEAMDAVMFNYPSGKRLFISDYSNARILVYKDITGITSWFLY
ncbi:MAG: hypothetical protein N2246_01635 [Candidatus Sumerlaeia bacterium]|nr:hypothetical protein [Candidatus Sumerlaeia bacterium]